MQTYVIRQHVANMACLSFLLCNYSTHICKGFSLQHTNAQCLHFVLKGVCESLLDKKLGAFKNQGVTMDEILDKLDNVVMIIILICLFHKISLLIVLYATFVALHSSVWLIFFAFSFFSL